MLNETKAGEIGKTPENVFDKYVRSIPFHDSVTAYNLGKSGIK
jgi:hypothetical protein